MNRRLHVWVFFLSPPDLCSELPSSVVEPLKRGREENREISQHLEQHWWCLDESTQGTILDLSGIHPWIYSLLCGQWWTSTTYNNQQRWRHHPHPRHLSRWPRGTVGILPPHPPPSCSPGKRDRSFGKLPSPVSHTPLWTWARVGSWPVSQPGGHTAQTTERQ